ncbi:MAG: ECF transporter S component [Clostridia bacterium]|nr:ECF transporter S component [Clostridia bacterium]
MKFDAKLIAKIAIFTAIAYIISYLEFPIFPTAPFLKLDFSNVFILIGGFALGPIPGVIILIAKEALCLLKTSTVVGQLANLLIGLSYILLPILVYHFKKGIKTVIITLSVSTVLQVVVGLLVNRFINFPLYGLPVETFYSLFTVILLFNLIKAVVISVLTILLYKRIKKLFRI